MENGSAKVNARSPAVSRPRGSARRAVDPSGRRTSTATAVAPAACRRSSAARSAGPPPPPSGSPSTLTTTSRTRSPARRPGQSARHSDVTAPER
jgi:hypothetical protein